MEEHKYLKPFRKCSDILKETEGVNYIIVATDAVEDDEEQALFAGGSGWNIEFDDGGPNFETMVGGLIEQYMEENGMSYKEKLKCIRRFSTELLEHVTDTEEQKRK